MELGNTVGYIAAFCTTAAYIPQALKTIKSKDTSSLSLPMYCLMAFGTLMWFLYGIVNNQAPVIIANFITLILAGIILFYKVKYK